MISPTSATLQTPTTIQAAIPESERPRQRHGFTDGDLSDPGTYRDLRVSLCPQRCHESCPTGSRSGAECVPHGVALDSPVVSAQLSLEDAWLKLQWAQQIYSALRGELESLERSDSHRISFEVDSDSGEYVFLIHDLPPLDPTWGLRIGDCLHNARCALDYLMVRLVALGMGKNPAEVEDVQFPIYQEPKRFNGAISDLKQHRVLAGWLARVEELQPFNAGNPSIWGWSEDGFGEEHMPRLPSGLDRLTILDNLDKHRCVLQPWHGRKLWGVHSIRLQSSACWEAVLQWIL